MTVRMLLAGCALAAAAALTGCGSPRPAHNRDRQAQPSLRAPGPLTHYRAWLPRGTGRQRMTIRTQVHSPTNWASESGLAVRHIGSMSYVHFGRHWFAHQEQRGDYAQTNLPAFARQFYAMTRAHGAVVRRGGACRQAGLAGHTWTVGAADGASFGETFTACVADTSGALLKLVIGARGTLLGGHYASEVYTITAVGNVPPLQVPADVAGH